MSLGVERCAMDELSLLVYPRTDESSGGQVSYELNLFDFLELHPFVRCCSHCEKFSEDLKRCSRCRQANYCSSECQRNDWKRHKLTCTSISSID